MGQWRDCWRRDGSHHPSFMPTIEWRGKPTPLHPAWTFSPLPTAYRLVTPKAYLQGCFKLSISVFDWLNVSWHCNVNIVAFLILWRILTLISVLYVIFIRQPQMIQAKLLKADLHGALITGNWLPILNAGMLLTWDSSEGWKSNVTYLSRSQLTLWVLS